MDMMWSLRPSYNSLVHHLQAADNIFVLEHGTISLRGKLDEIHAQGFDLDQAIGNHAIRQDASKDMLADMTIEKKEEDNTEEDVSETLRGNGVLVSYKFFLKMNGYYRAVISAVRMWNDYSVLRVLTGYEISC